MSTGTEQQRMAEEKGAPWIPWCHAPGIWSVARERSDGRLDYFTITMNLKHYEAKRLAIAASGGPHV